MAEKKNKVLAIDDCQTNLLLLQAHLKKMSLTPLLADNVLDGVDIAIKEQPDLILLDVMMPEIDGFEGCRMLKTNARTARIPIIFLSAKNDTGDKVKGLELGAIDYLTKPFDTGELKARIGIVLKMIELQEKLTALANTDELTGLSNRRHLLSILDHEILRVKIKGGSVAVMMFDIDCFKNINDTYGHLAGDKILSQLSCILNENIYPLDIAARYGGEEFVVIAPGMPEEAAADRTEKIRKAVEDFAWKVDNQPIMVTCSAGVALCEDSNQIDSYELIKRADAALYRAKAQGKNRVVAWHEIKDEQTETDEAEQKFKYLQEKISHLAKQLRSQTLCVLESFVKAIAEKDHAMMLHAENVKRYALAIAEEMNVSQSLKEQLAKSALLHDLGKIVLPPKILDNEDRLTPAERKAFQKHPSISAEILSPIDSLSKELKIIKHHHENYDGSGYPCGLSGKKIPVGARILAVANEFEKMFTDKGGTGQADIDEIIGYIKSFAGSKYDTEVVQALEAALGQEGLVGGAKPHKKLANQIA